MDQIGSDFLKFGSINPDQTKIVRINPDRIKNRSIDPIKPWNAFMPLLYQKLKKIHINRIQISIDPD